MVRAIDLIGNNSLLQNHWLRRFLAAVIDGIIMYILYMIVFVVLIFTFFVIPFINLLYPIFTGLLWLLYAIVLEGMTGATIGKKVLNLRVVSFEGPMSISKAFIRNITKIFGLIFFLDWLAGFVTDGDPRQRFTDRYANTTVIRTDIQEVFAGAFQPPSGPMPQPYGQQPGPAYGAPPGQYPPQQQPYPQQQAPYPQQQPYAQQPEPSPAPQQPEAVEPTAELTAAEGEEVLTREELVNLRKDELIKIAKGKNMKVSGTKRDLIDRILGEEVP
jgi:uncharacterized RDD family membrane protein YckC